METQKIWSPAIRLLHWTIAIFVTALVITGRAEAKVVHQIIGPILLMAVVGRIWIGYTGKPYERFSGFFNRPSIIFEQIKGMLRGHTKRTASHNPLAGPILFLIIFTLLLNSLLGVFLSAGNEKDGLLAPFVSGIPGDATDAVSVLHALLGNVMIGLVLLHFGGLVSHTILHKEPIARAMITGEKIIDDDC